MPHESRDQHAADLHPRAGTARARRALARAHDALAHAELVKQQAEEARLHAFRARMDLDDLSEIDPATSAALHAALDHPEHRGEPGKPADLL